MAQKKYKPTREEARAAYWEAVARWDEVRTDRYSTWKQMGFAADDVKAALRVWVAAEARAMDKKQGLSERRLLAAIEIKKILPEALKNGR